MDYLMDVLFGEHSTAGDEVMFMTLDDIDKRCPRGLNASMVDDPLWVTAPFDDGCLRTFFQRMSVHLRRYNEWEEMLYTFLYFVISLCALVGNGVVILAVIRKREMRTSRNVLIVNLALSNLMLALTTIPFLWFPSIEFEFPYSKFFCKFANALPGSNIYCSTLTISVMAIDRYYSVKKMSIGSVNQGCLKGILLSLMIWFTSFLLSFPLLLYYDTTMLYVFKDVTVYDAEKNITQLRSYGWRQCRLSTGGSASGDDDDGMNADDHARAIQLIMSFLQVLFLYLVPLIVLALFNVKLNRFLKSNAKQMSRTRNGTTAIRRESVLTSPRTRNNGSPGRFPSRSPIEPDLPSCSPSVMRVDGTIVERPMDRRRSRTTMLLIAMAVSYGVLWFPFTMVSTLIDFNVLYLENSAAIIERIDQSCKLISILSIGVNPFLYGFLNTNFRHEFTDIFNSMFCFCATKSQIENRSSRGNVYSAVRPGHLDARSPSLFDSIQSAWGSMFSLRNRASVEHGTFGTRTFHSPANSVSSSRVRSKSVSSDACVLHIFSMSDSARSEAEHRLLAVPSSG